MAPWPLRADGSPKSMGEMAPQERDMALEPILPALAAELSAVLPRVLGRRLPDPKPQAPSPTLSARVCTFCGKGKGTTCYRQDSGPFFAHPGCFRKYRAQRAQGGR